MTDPITRGQEQAAIAFRDRVMPLSFTPDELQADVRAARKIVNDMRRATLPANAKLGDLFVALDPIDGCTVHVYEAQRSGNGLRPAYRRSVHIDAVNDEWGALGPELADALRSGKWSYVPIKMRTEIELSSERGSSVGAA